MSPKTQTKSSNIRLTVFLIFLLAILAASLDYPVIWDKGADFVNKHLGLGVPHFHKTPFRLGLDLQGGTHLIYEADLSQIEDKQDSMEGIRDVIERRVNLFGVTEPLVQINKVKESYRLIVELPGVRDIHQAIEMIGETPFLEFKTQKDQQETEKIIQEQKEGKSQDIDPYFEQTELTGRYLKGAKLEFNQNTYEPNVALEFNDQGKELFAEITKKEVGNMVAIYLDGSPISTPVVQEEITGGKAQITGDFTVEEAKRLVQRLNAGALPVPITLISQQSIGASLGERSLTKSLRAALIGLIAIGLFMIIYYRLPGLLAVTALIIYTCFVLAIFKLIPVTLTLAGIAGFILSVGMAVDANILIFERMKEELRNGKSLKGSIHDGFKRAWPSIRDGNISTLITATILFYFGTSMIKGFALTLFFGVLISMLTAIIITRTFLQFFTGSKVKKWKWLYGYKSLQE